MTLIKFLNAKSMIVVCKLIKYMQVTIKHPFCGMAKMAVILRGWKPIICKSVMMMKMIDVLRPLLCIW
jgi:hypothetical protein